jgi:hypothetical protein
VGTGYAAAGNPAVAMRVAADEGIADRVTELPDRVSFLDAQKSMMDADALLLLGSQDEGYTPSKLNQCLALPKPIACAAPAGSRLFGSVAGFDTVAAVSGDPAAGAMDGAIERFARLLANPGSGDYAARAAAVQDSEAAKAAARDCRLFDEAVAAGARRAE